MKFDIIACLTQNSKKEFGIGEKVVDGNDHCECSRDSTSGKVNVKCLAKYVCKLDDASEMALNEKKLIGNTQVQCQKSGSAMKLAGIGKSKINDS